MKMDIRNSEQLRDTIDLVENIEFSENLIPKKEIKEEEGFKIENQEFSKIPAFDFKHKLEPVETSEIGQAKIKTEPEEFFSNDQAETLSNESIEIKDEFMWAMKDFECSNVPPKNIEQHTAVIHEKKKPFVCSMCPSKFATKGILKKHIAAMHENKKTFVCSLCWYKSTQKCHVTKHIAAVHEKKKPIVCSMCPSVFAEKGHLTKHIAAVHEKKKLFVCFICQSEFAKKGTLNNKHTHCCCA